MHCRFLPVALALCALPSLAHAQQLISNGGFETGTFSGWTQTNQDNGSFVLIAPGADTPGGTTFATAPNAAGGSFFAVTASDNPGTHALLQNFVVPVNTVDLKLQFQMFVNDQSGAGAIVDPSGLDNRTGGSNPTADNQFARVDILRAGASDFSTSAADIVDSLYLGVDNAGGTTPNPFLSYSFDLTSLLTPGSGYRLRFAEADNLSSINLGVDNVSLVAAPRASAVPEGSSLLMMACGLSALSGMALRKLGKRTVA